MKPITSIAPMMLAATRSMKPSTIPCASWTAKDANRHAPRPTAIHAARHSLGVASPITSETTAAAAHTLGSSSANIGANRLAEQVETLASPGKAGRHEAAHRLFGEAQGEHQRVLAEIETLLADGA